MKNKLLAGLILAVSITLGVAAVAASARQYDGGAPTGCEWQWDGDHWVLKIYACSGGCYPPANPGEFVGDTVYTPCFFSPCDCGTAHSTAR